MTHLRNILLDLVEKRLWPLALALVAALVAVPVVLGADPAPAPALPPAAGEGTAAAQVAIARPDQPGGPARLGPLRDPFARATAPAPAAPATDGTSGGPSGGAPATSPATGGTGAPFDDGLPLPSVGPLPGDPLPGAVAPVDAGPDVVTVRVGRTGRLTTRRDLAVRAPLPSVSDPFLVYLGNKPDGESAQFLVSADAVLTGDAACRPSPDLCEEIVMKAGMTEYFDVERPDGEVVQYQMDVVRVGRGD